MIDASKMRKNLFLDIHALQTLPPSCVNRDNTNTPKTCIYGGKTRSRASSQCWKRAIRKYMEAKGLSEIGVRTVRFQDKVEEELIKNFGFSEEDAKTAAKNAVQVADFIPVRAENKKGLDKEKTEQAEKKEKDKKDTMAFFSEAEIKAFSKVIADNKEAGIDEDAMKKIKKELLASIDENPSSDILLFGRMFAKEVSLNRDAACQVAHAISVNETYTEYDFFTAIDDLADESSTGAPYMGAKEFTSPVFYRYANINLSETSELIRMDRANAAKTARDFVEAFLYSMPTGSMNGYANATLPEYVMVTLREDRPVSFAPAFIEAVKSDNYQDEAERKLEEYSNWVSEKAGAPAVVLSLKDLSFNEIFKAVENEIQKRI